jgi:hypothetical protein
LLILFFIPDYSRKSVDQQQKKEKTNMTYIETIIDKLPYTEAFRKTNPYPDAIEAYNDGHIFMTNYKKKDIMVATNGAIKHFDGKTYNYNNIEYKIMTLSHENAEVLRKLFPYTAPIKVLDQKRSFGLGDRLGIAGPGHLDVFKAYDAYPILAQQSIRELNLTHRTYKDVLDAATFAVFKEGYKEGFGADGDHLKKPEEIEYALSLGYTMITLDCSDYIQNDIIELTDEAILKQDVISSEYENRYLNQVFELEGYTVVFDELSLKKSILIYKKAIEYAASIYRTYLADGNANANFEISIDETGTPTTPTEHFFVANELSIRCVKLDTMAPRFCGDFQKGVDYVGDINQFESELKIHVSIANHFGYKLSIHSGSDKFSIFELIGKHTKGNFHVKTSGTNWLEAMRVVAFTDPQLYRLIHTYALSVFHDARQYYHVTTHLENIPNIEELKDHELVDLFKQNDLRQLIHITYGYILNAKDVEGKYLFKDKLYDLWEEKKDIYRKFLSQHIKRHLERLYAGFEVKE